MEYKSKFKAQEIDALLDKVEALPEGGNEGGVPIVSSEEERDALNLPVGSLAVVALPGTINVVSFRGLYQTGVSIIDQENFVLTDPSLPSSVKELEFSAPPSGFVPSQTAAIALVPRSLSVSNLNALVIAEGRYMSIESGSESSGIILEDNGDGSYSINQDSARYINNKLATEDWCYISAAAFGMGEETLSESDFDSLDNWVKAKTGTASEAEVFIKKDVYESLDSKAKEAIALAEKKQSKREVVYTKTDFYDYTHNVMRDDTIEVIESYGTRTAKIAIFPLNKYYSEYVFHLYNVGGLKFKDVVSSGDLNILWANGVAPEIIPNTHYEINLAAIKIGEQIVYKGVCTSFV